MLRNQKLLKLDYKRKKCLEEVKISDENLMAVESTAIKKKAMSSIDALRISQATEAKKVATRSLSHVLNTVSSIENQSSNCRSNRSRGFRSSIRREDKLDYNKQRAYTTRRRLKSICYVEALDGSDNEYNNTSNDCCNTKEDEDFNIDEYEGIGSFAPQRKKKRSGSRKNRLFKAVMSAYDRQDKNQHNSLVLSSRRFHKPSEQTLVKLSNEWVCELQQRKTSSFRNMYLTILRGCSNSFLNVSLDGLTNSSSQFWNQNIKSITFLKRSAYGQIYIAKGLQNSHHFSISQEAVDTLFSLGHSKGVQVSKIKSQHKKNCDNNSPTLSTDSISYYNFDNKTTNPNVSSLTTLFKDMVNSNVLQELFPCQLMSSSSKSTTKKRSKRHIHLGITNRKMDQLERITITGRCGLNLISPRTKSMHLNDDTLKRIGKVLLHLGNNILPTIFPECEGFSTTGVEWTKGKKYLKMFAKQLLLDPEDEDRLIFPAVSILVNQELKIHCDSMNPTDPRRDFTMVTTIQIDTTEILDAKLRSIVQKEYPFKLPICLVVYNRKALDDFVKRQCAISTWVDSNRFERPARSKLNNLLHAVNSFADYQGTFFCKSRDHLMKHFISRENLVTSQPVADFPEAIDKMAMWSSLLHMFSVYVLKYGLYFEDVLSFALFYAHQCTGTCTIVPAMVVICEDNYIWKNPMHRAGSLYLELARVCIDLRNLPVGKLKDVGASKIPRIQTSSSTLYTREQLQSITFLSNEIFASYRVYMGNTKTNDLYSKLKLYNDLKDLLKMQEDAKKNKLFKGLLTVRLDHFVSLSSLLGLLPLDYYVNVPMHLSGGPGCFMTDDVDFASQEKDIQGHTKEEKLLNWNCSIMKEMENIYTRDFTPNMLENTSCIIGRGDKKRDVFYFLPRFCSAKIVHVNQMQLCFRVEGYGCKDWCIEAYNGDKLIIFSSNSQPILDIFKFRKEERSGVIRLNIAHDVKTEDLMLMLTI